MHIRAHIKSPGHLTKGNNLADDLVNFALTEDEHQHLHTNAPHLHVQYKIPYRQAKRIFLNCPICLSSPAFNTKYPWFEGLWVGFHPYLANGCNSYTRIWPVILCSYDHRYILLHDMGYTII